MRLATLVVATLAAVAASAAPPDVPRRKSGVWDISITAPGMPQMNFRECVDQKNDDMAKPPQPGDEDVSCSKVEWRREGTGYVMDSVCKVDGVTATTRSVFTGSFDSAFKAEHKSTYRPPLEGMREATMTMNARWTGPCPPGQKPGDVDIPGMPSTPKKR